MTDFSRISCILMVSALLGGGIWVHHDHVIHDDYQTYRAMNARKRGYQRDKDTWSVAKLRKHYDAVDPNLANVEKENTNNVTKGMRLAFSDCHSNSDYAKNKDEITSLLGSGISNKVLSLVKPQASQAFSHATSMSDHLTNCTVSYGEFMTNAHMMPVEIVTNYQTPSYDPNAGAGSHITHKKVAKTGSVMINAMLNTKSGKMQVNSEYDTLAQN